LHETFKNHPGKGKRMAVPEDLLKRDSEERRFDLSCKLIGRVSLNLKTEMAEGESAAVIGPTRLPASRVASSYRCNRCEPGSLVEPSTTPSLSLSISVSRLKPGQFELRGEWGEGEAFGGKVLLGGLMVKAP
jgi:hypothetical protein